MRLIGLVVVITVNLLLAPLAVDAQPSEKVYRIGMLERTSKTLNAASLNGFLRGMQELGYLEGKHFVIEYRSADGLDERFPELAADLVRVTSSTSRTGTTRSPGSRRFSGTEAPREAQV
jgi:putative ABC transport system substrate-binding protein